MNAAVEKKPTITLDKKNANSDTPSVQTGTVTPPEKNNVVNLREALTAIDAERNELAKKAIDGIKPGKSFDTGIVREINKLETKKNRLIVTRFAALLRKNSPDVQAIVHQIIEL